MLKEQRTDSDGSERVWLQFEESWGGIDMLWWVVVHMIVFIHQFVCNLHGTARGCAR